MSIDVHTIALVVGTQISRTDRLIMGVIPSLAYAAGSGAGAVVTLPVVLSLPVKYAVDLGLDQDATAWVTNKTTAGFTINIAPRLPANTLAAGAVDVTIAA